MRRERPHGGVAVDEISIVADEQRPIGVSIECDAEVSMFLDDFLPKRIDVKGAAIAVDVATIRRRIDGDYPGAAPSDKEGSEGRPGAVCTVDNPLESLES